MKKLLKALRALRQAQEAVEAAQAFGIDLKRLTGINVVKQVTNVTDLVSVGVRIIEDTAADSRFNRDEHPLQPFMVKGMTLPRLKNVDRQKSTKHVSRRVSKI